MDKNKTFLFSANKNRDIERTNHTTQRKDINNKIEYIHSYTSDMESGVTLADIRKEETLQRNCTKVGIVYIARTANETEQERDARHHQLQLAIKSKRRIENKSQRSPDKERRLKENNVHAQRRHRANFSPEQQANARRINTASRQQQRASLSSKQQDHARRINTATRQQQRANLSPEQQDHARRTNGLKLYIGAHVMVNNNDLLKSHGIGNGSMARVKRVQLKSTATNPGWKNWEGKKVYCVSVNDVEYIEIERCRRDSYNQRT
jgi:hypothetical protein